MRAGKAAAALPWTGRWRAARLTTAAPAARVGWRAQPPQRAAHLALSRCSAGSPQRTPPYAFHCDVNRAGALSSRQNPVPRRQKPARAAHAQAAAACRRRLAARATPDRHGRQGSCRILRALAARLPQAQGPPRPRRRQSRCRAPPAALAARAPAARGALSCWRATMRRWARRPLWCRRPEELQTGASAAGRLARRRGGRHAGQASSRGAQDGTARARAQARAPARAARQVCSGSGRGG